MKQLRCPVGVLIFVFAILFAMFSGQYVFADATTQSLLQQGDLTYLGKFTVPNPGSGSSANSFAYGGMGLAVSADGQSLYMGGHVYNQSLGRIAIPATLGGSTTVIQAPVSIPGSVGSGTTELSGAFVYNGRLIVQKRIPYDTNGGGPTHAVGNLNIGGFSTFRGMANLNSAAYGNGCMGIIPPEWQSLLGGPAFTCSGPMSINSVSANGPTFYVFNPDDVNVTTPIPSIPLMYYTLANPLDNANVANNYYSRSDYYTAGLVFPSGYRSVLYIGRHGYGPPTYKQDDGGCGGINGEGAAPYRRQVTAFDANELLAVKNGTKQPHQVRPYTWWTLPGPSDSCAKMTFSGLAYDPGTRRIYIALNYGDNPEIHVYQVSGASTPDTSPPTSPTTLAATSPNQSSISVSWTASTDNIGVTAYRVERCQGTGCSNFAQVGTPTASPFVDSGLTANTFYNYHVRATDAAGNLSGWSNVVGATTQSPDTQAPTAPSNLQTSVVSSSSIDLTWTASTDNVGVTGYKVERCSGSGCTNFTQIATPTSDSYSDTGLSASTLYRYQVRAVDGAGNNSGYSNISSATTPVAPPSPTFISEYETAWNTSTSPKTTTNFSVQSGDTLVAYAVNESSSTTIATPPIGTLTGTWTLRQTISASNFTYLRLWTMNVSSNQTNVNVSFTNDGGNFGGDVLHFRNASGIGVTAQANSNTGNPTLTLNGVGENSSIVMVNGDWSARTGARTYNTSQAGTFTETSAFADGSTYGVEAGYYANAGTAGNKTIGITAPTGMTWALAAVEVKGNSGGGGGDTTPPTSPTNLTASAPSSSSISVTWTAATDNVAVTGYIVERCQGAGCSNFTQVGTPTASPFVDSGLTPNTFYNYHVRATDAAGNLSGWSNVVGATTQSGGGGTACNTVIVSNVSQLVNAVNAANGNPSCSTTILIANGTYTLSDMLPVSAPNMTIKSQSGNRDAVVLQGDAMTSSASVKMIFRVDANNFTAESMTLQRVGWHLIQVVGENNRDNFTAKNMVFRNAWEQMLKVTYVDTSTVGSDNGLVENSLFEFTSGQAGQYYTGGIDAHNAKNWIVRGNTFKNIISPSGSVAEHAIHFWSNSEDTLVEKNLIINCDRGIGFGLVQGRGHLRGIIRNNMIYHTSGNGSFADVAIEADESPNTQIYNNTIFMQNTYPNAIEYRFPLSSGLIIRNNLTNKTILARDGATAMLSNNITNAASAWFVNVGQGDLHLANNTTAANNAGIAISGLTDDFDGNTRPQGGGIDVGADEYVSGGTATPCNTVTTANFSQPAYSSYGAPFDAFQTSTSLMNANCSSSDPHTIQATLGQTGDTTRIVYTKGYYYANSAWTQYTGTCTGAQNGDWCQGSVSATITNPDISTASASAPAYFVGMTCSVQGGSWRCGCRDTMCSNFYWMIQGAGQ
jgi:chitodextrinase